MKCFVSLPVGHITVVRKKRMSTLEIILYITIIIFLFMCNFGMKELHDVTQRACMNLFYGYFVTGEKKSSFSLYRQCCEW